MFLTPALSVIAASHEKHVPAEPARLYRLRGGKKQRVARRASVISVLSELSALGVLGRLVSGCRCSTRGLCNKDEACLQLHVA